MRTWMRRRLCREIHGRRKGGGCPSVVVTTSITTTKIVLVSLIMFVCMVQGIKAVTVEALSSATTTDNKNNNNTPESPTDTNNLPSQSSSYSSSPPVSTTTATTVTNTAKHTRTPTPTTANQSTLDGELVTNQDMDGDNDEAMQQQPRASIDTERGLYSRGSRTDTHPVPYATATSPDTSTKQPRPPPSPQQLQQQQQRLWGAPHEDNEPRPERIRIDTPLVDATLQESNLQQQQQQQEKQHQQQHHNVHIPFVPTKTTTTTTSTSGTHPHHLHPPPDGFLITARVYIDPTDKLGHIDDDTNLRLPYWDCGTVGSTTMPLPVKQVVFRHSLGMPCQACWIGTDGKHAQLAVALDTPFLLQVSSGATKTIQPGQAILLEDVLLSGHKFKPLTPHTEVHVMLLTLPHPYYSTGKDSISIDLSPPSSSSSSSSSSSFWIRRPPNPCPVDDMGHTTSSSSTSSATTTTTTNTSFPTRPAEPLTSLSSLTPFPRNHNRRFQRIAFGIIGLSLSTLVADFLGKTAPLWLAVGVGGTAFVVAGTVGTMALADTITIRVHAWLQQRRLQSKHIHEQTQQQQQQQQQQQPPTLS